MQRPPRNPAQKLFDWQRVLMSIVQGFTVLFAVLAVYWISLQIGHDASDARALGFSTLVVGNLCLIFTNRSWRLTIWQTLGRTNHWLWVVTMSALITLAMVLYVPGLRIFFHFSLLHPGDVAVAGLAGFAGVLWFELMKLLGTRVRVLRTSERKT